MFLACSFFLSGVYGVSGDFIATSLRLSPVVIHCNFLIQCSTMVFSRFSRFTFLDCGISSFNGFF